MVHGIRFGSVPGSIPSPVSVGDLHQKHRQFLDLQLIRKVERVFFWQTGFLIVNDGNKNMFF